MSHVNLFTIFALVFLLVGVIVPTDKPYYMVVSKWIAAGLFCYLLGTLR